MVVNNNSKAIEIVLCDSDSDRTIIAAEHQDNNASTSIDILDEDTING
jgi:hypothetical protein